MSRLTTKQRRSRRRGKRVPHGFVFFGVGNMQIQIDGEWREVPSFGSFPINGPSRRVELLDHGEVDIPVSRILFGDHADPLRLWTDHDARPTQPPATA